MGNRILAEAVHGIRWLREWRIERLTARRDALRIQCDELDGEPAAFEALCRAEDDLAAALNFKRGS